MNNPPNSKIVRTAVLINIIVFLSGLTFLVCEVSWTRMLSLVLGATVPAATVVLMSCMAGFGAGAWFWGRISESFPDTRKLLFLTSGMTGILGLAARSLIPSLVKLYAAVPGGTGDTTVFLAACAILILPTFCMGGILPVAVKLIVTEEKQLAEGVGRIYALNTLGSTVGGLLGGFVLIRAIGLNGVLLAAACVNMVLAAVSLTLPCPKDMQNLGSREKSLDGGRCNCTDSEVKLSRAKLSALLAAFVFGFIGLIQQVIWIRVFKIYLTNTSYTFALVISVVIAGLSIGSWIYRGAGNGIRNNVNAMILTLITAAVLSLTGLAAIITAPALLLLPLHETLDSPLYRIFLPPLLTSLLVVLPASVAGGFAFPLACRIYAAGSRDISRKFGTCMMVNTLGCVAGPAVAAFVLIPMLGVAASVLLMALILFATALGLTLLAGTGRWKKALMIIPAIAVCALAVALLPGTRIRILPPSFSRTNKEILFYKETIDATIVVCRDSNAGIAGRMTYVNNSAVIGSGYDAIKAVKMIGHLPFYAGLDCRKALVVGFGIGVTASTIASYDDVERIDCVEIAPGLKDSAHLYRELNLDVIKDKRLNFYAGDGRHYLQTSSDKYDLISSDPTHPVLGSGDLYSREYFTLCREHLNPGGMVSQYLPLHELRTEDFLGIIKTFYSVFPDATVWLGHSHAILLGSLKPMRIDFEQWKTRIAEGREDPLFYRDPYYMAASFIFGSGFLSKIPIETRINTDDRSYLEFFAYETLDPGVFSKNAEFLRINRGETDDIFFNIDDPMKMKRFLHGSDLFLQAMILFQKGDKQKALDALRKAEEINPENKEFPFLIRYYFLG